MSGLTVKIDEVISALADLRLIKDQLSDINTMSLHPGNPLYTDQRVESISNNLQKHTTTKLRAFNRDRIVVYGLQESSSGLSRHMRLTNDLEKLESFLLPLDNLLSKQSISDLFHL